MPSASCTGRARTQADRVPTRLVNAARGRQIRHPCSPLLAPSPRSSWAFFTPIGPAQWSLGSPLARRSARCRGGVAALQQAVLVRGTITFSYPGPYDGLTLQDDAAGIHIDRNFSCSLADYRSMVIPSEAEQMCPWERA